jgi:tRNA 2-thiouridine synthesizing protein E
MAYEFEGNSIEADDNGYLVNITDWSEGLAAVIAESEGISELTSEHWDLINFLRDAYVNEGGRQPNNREINKAMGKAWDRKVDSKAVFALFPLGPSKQAGKIAGLPESKRKGGY